MTFSRLKTSVEMDRTWARGPVGVCRSGAYEMPRLTPPVPAGQRPDRIFERYSVRELPAGGRTVLVDVTRYVPLEQILDSLIKCGLCERRVHTELETSWLIAATIALGHAADRRIRDGIVDPPTAASECRTAIRLLYGSKRT